MDVNI